MGRRNRILSQILFQEDEVTRDTVILKPGSTVQSMLQNQVTLSFLRIINNTFAMAQKLAINSPRQNENVICPQQWR